MKNREGHFVCFFLTKKQDLLAVFVIFKLIDIFLRFVRLLSALFMISIHQHQFFVVFRFVHQSSLKWISTKNRIDQLFHVKLMNINIEYSIFSKI